MTNLKHKLHVLALCAAAIAFLGGPLLAQKPKAAVVAINDAKADKDFFNLVKDSFTGSLKSSWGLKVVDNAVTSLALKAVNSEEKLKAAGKLLSVDYVCILGLSNDYSGGFSMIAILYNAHSGEAIEMAERSISQNPNGNEVVRLSKALATEMDRAIKKKVVTDKASAIKDLVKH